MKKEYVVVLIAVGSGLLAAILVFNFLKSASQVENRFVIARSAIPKGQIIHEEDVGLSQIMKKSDTKNLFLETQDVVGQKALHDIAAGNLIYRSKITRQSSEPGAAPPQKQALPIPKEMRALTIARKDITSAPDFLDIGSFVDIIGPVAGPSGQSEMRTIVTSRQVISVNPLNGPQIESITVAVMPDEAEAVLEAASINRLQLLVREGQEQRMFEPVPGSVEIIRGIQKEGAFRR